MKRDPSKWNPFKFLRKTSDQKREPSAKGRSADSSLPAEWSDWPMPMSMMAEPMRMMQEMLRDPFSGTGPLNRWFGDFSPSTFQPRIDVVEDSDALRVTAELPGMDREDIEVMVEDDALVLRGEKKLERSSDEKGCYRIERAFGSFQRVIPLPDDVEFDRAEAKFDKGLLTLRLPRSARPSMPKGRQIPIS